MFISVKGIYYQASIYGQEVTWLTPHALSQTLPEDVDYRVMLAFLEFYAAMMGFVNYKLYYDRSFRYPPLLDTRLEDAAGGIVAVIHDLADKVHGETTGARAIAGAAKKTSERAAATEARLGSLKEKMAAFADAEVDDEEAAAAAAAARAIRTTTRTPTAPTPPPPRPRLRTRTWKTSSRLRRGGSVAREDAKLCATLFKGLVFFIQREVPRDMMVFIIRSFGGEVCWEGEGSPYDESDGGVTHHVCDRPMEGRMNAAREYVQPQWVADCVNWRVLIPTADYAPGKPPPPHLSPFVNAEDEGYTPDYQATLQRLQAQAKAAREGRSLADVSEEEAGTRLLTAREEAEEEERAHARDLDREARGIPYSRSLQEGEEGSSDEESESGDEDREEEDDEEGSESDDDSEEEEEEDSEEEEEDGSKAPKKRKASRLTQEMAMREKDIIINKRMKDMGEEEEVEAMRYVMLPRKKRELYKAMQLGLAKKEARAAQLEERKKKLKSEGKYGHDVDEKKEKATVKATPAKKKGTKKK